MLRIDIDARVGDFRLQPEFDAEDELVVLFGPSGCGKSLTLQAVAGLLTPDRGRIELPGGGVAFDSAAGIDVAPQERSVGYLVQELALFPHMTVGQNIEFPLSNWPPEQRRARVAHLIDMFGLEGLEARRPRQISGGQQQRVALARALAAEPALLLLDEPFSALDATLRHNLRRELAELRRRLELTALFVTHDLSEAYALADRVVIYDNGRVLQHGPREDVFRRPATRRVAELTEVRNLVPGTIRAYADGVAVVETAWFTATVRDHAEIFRGDVYICIRPEHIIVLRDEREPRDRNDPVIETEIVDEVATGNNHRLAMRTATGSSRGSEPFVFEVDVPAHPYEVLGIGSRRQWRIVLSPQWMSLVPANDNSTSPGHHPLEEQKPARPQEN
jgi:molybdate transport system ATP-binding protein